MYIGSNGDWTGQQKLAGGSSSIAVSDDTAVRGRSGSAYVYVRSNGVWSEQQKLTASDGAAEDQFGFSVSIDDDTAVIGAYGDGTFSGSAYVYETGVR